MYSWRGGVPRPPSSPPTPNPVCDQISVAGAIERPPCASTIFEISRSGTLARLPKHYRRKQCRMKGVGRGGRSLPTSCFITEFPMAGNLPKSCTVNFYVTATKRAQYTHTINRKLKVNQYRLLFYKMEHQ